MVGRRYRFQLEVFKSVDFQLKGQCRLQVPINPVLHELRPRSERVVFGELSLEEE